MYVSTLIVSLISILYLAQVSRAVCPDATDIKPCTCDDEGLQCLKLNNSGLARVFRAPADRKAIRRVWIFQTNLTSLPKHAFNDYIIRDLYLDLNQIKTIESGAFGLAMRTLQSLSLTRNLLASFPFDDLRHMKKLKQFGLGHNQLTRIHSHDFPTSDSLESIDLSHNNITIIEANAFADLHEVSLIDLSRNKLKELDSNSLMIESSSRHLAISLRGNQIDKIASDAFGDRYPQTIDLSRNQLTYLDELVFAPLLKNSVVNVDDNPFSCTGCHLYKWLLNLDSESLSNLENFACVDETKLEDLTLEMIGCATNNRVL